jgi:hypothetical protein
MTQKKKTNLSTKWFCLFEIYAYIIILKKKKVQLPLLFLSFGICNVLSKVEFAAAGCCHYNDSSVVFRK